MQILLINYEYPPIGGGAATATAEIAKSMVRLGHSATVLTAGFGDQVGNTVESGISVIRIRSRRARADRSSMIEMGDYVLRASLVLPRLLHELRPDACIVFFSLPCGPVAWWARRLSGMPYVVALRGGDVPGTETGMGWIHRLLQPFRRRILRDALAVVANSAGLRDLSERADPAPVSVIPNGVDCELFTPEGAPAADSGAPFRFLFVGRLNEQKNVALLLDAFADLRAAGDGRCHLRIVGDGPLKDALQAQASAAGLADSVEWMGWQPRAAMPEIYRTADCLVNPSRYEGMPNVVLEAMACGLPVVASAVAGNRELVTEGANGRLFPDGDRNALRTTLLAMTADRASSAKLGTEGRRNVSAHYSWAATARAYLALFSVATLRGNRAAI